MKVDVIYFVESVPKELDVACIVRLLAKQRHGLNVEIVSFKDHTPAWLKWKRPRLLVLPTCYYADAWGLRRHIGHWPGTPFLNLTWEELFCKANLTWRNPRDGFAQKHVQHHVWGDFYRKFLLSHGVPAEHILVNGHPGYRLYTDPYRRYFPSKEELALKHDLDSAKRWIFLPENYGWAFYTDANIQGRIQDGMDPSIPPILQEYCRSTLKTVLGWCETVSRAADIEMIIRPRPTTPAAEFRSVCQELHGGNLDRVRMIKDGTVNEWILASDVVVSSFSTCLLEAAIAGKPAYMLEPLPLPDPLWSIWNDDADSLTTQEEFQAVCQGKVTVASDQRLYGWAHANLLANGDPIENLVRYIADVCDGKIKLPSSAGAPIAARRRTGLVKGLVRDTYDGLQALISPRREEPDRAMAFGKKDVEQRVRLWSRVLGAEQTEPGGRASRVTA